MDCTQAAQGGPRHCVNHDFPRRQGQALRAPMAALTALAI